MAGNTFTKRQKERARQEKQRDKAARRLQRKQEKTPLKSLDDLIAPLEETHPDLQDAPEDEPQAAGETTLP
ncbi:MAG TPA: hypothetical protein VMS96_11705 [Terriglobales bacterium]|nr:hypothetical protein [Terriglobales bacterium]